MERASIILARLYWTFLAILALYESNSAFAGHPRSILSWIAGCAVLITSGLCWLPYPRAWMTAGVIGFIILMYHGYQILMFWPVGGDWSFTTLSIGPIHFHGLTARILWWAEPAFGFVFTFLLANFGAHRSDAKNNA